MSEELEKARAAVTAARTLKAGWDDRDEMPRPQRLALAELLDFATVNAQVATAAALERLAEAATRDTVVNNLFQQEAAG